MRLLVVEDNRGLVGNLFEYFEPRGHQLDAAPDGLTLSIQRQQGPDSHLAGDGWRRTETWLMPDQVRRRGEVLEFHLGPEICDRLAGVATVRLRVREPDIGVVGTTEVVGTIGAIGASSAASVGRAAIDRPATSAESRIFIGSPEILAVPPGKRPGDLKKREST